MSLWKKYCHRRAIKEGLGDGGDPVAKFKFNSDDELEQADDYEHNQQELFKIVLGKYPEETMDFLQGFARRGDEEVRALVKKLRKDHGPTLPTEPMHPSHGHEVVPSLADTGHNPAGESGEE